MVQAMVNHNINGYELIYFGPEITHLNDQKNIYNVNSSQIIVTYLSLAKKQYCFFIEGYCTHVCKCLGMN